MTKHPEKGRGQGHMTHFLFGCRSHISGTAEASRKFCMRVKGKVLPYSLPGVGPGADPGVPAVSPQMTWSHPPGGRLPLLFVRPAVTFPTEKRHRPNYTAWRVSSLPNAVTWKRTGRDSNSRLLGSRANTLPLSHTGHLYAGRMYQMLPLGWQTIPPNGLVFGHVTRFLTFGSTSTPREKYEFTNIARRAFPLR